MKLAFLTLLFKRFPLEYSFQIAQKYNFDGIEIWGGRPHAYPLDISEISSNIRRWKHQYNIDVPMYTPELLAYPYNLSSSSPTERRDTVNYLKKAVDLCREIECPEMLVSSDHPGYGRSFNECWSCLVDGLQELSAYAEENNVVLRMEPLGPNTSPIVTRCSDLLRLINDVKSPNLKAMMDMAIPPLCAEPYSEYFTMLGKDFSYVHICGCDGIYETHWQLSADENMVHMKDLFNILKAYDYKEWCSIEILEPYYRDPELYLSQALRILKSCL